MAEADDVAAIRKAITESAVIEGGEIVNPNTVAQAAWGAMQELPRRAKEVRGNRNG